MQTTRKLTALLLCLVMVCALFAGCANKPEIITTSPQPANAEATAAPAVLDEVTPLGASASVPVTVESATPAKVYARMVQKSELIFISGQRSLTNAATTVGVEKAEKYVVTTPLGYVPSPVYGTPVTPRIGVPIALPEKYGAPNGSNSFWYLASDGFSFSRMTYQPDRFCYNDLGGEYWCAIWNNVMHPGYAQYPVVAFVAPRGGSLRIDADILLRNTTTGDGYDGVTVYIYKNGRQLAKKAIDQKDSAWKHSVSVDVRADDVIYLVVTPNQMNYGDETLINRYALTYTSFDDSTGGPGLGEFPFTQCFGLPTKLERTLTTGGGTPRDPNLREEDLGRLCPELTKGVQYKLSDYAEALKNYNGDRNIKHYASDGRFFVLMNNDPNNQGGCYYYVTQNDTQIVRSYKNLLYTNASADAYPVVTFKSPQDGVATIDLLKLYRPVEGSDTGKGDWDGVVTKLVVGGKIYHYDRLNRDNPNATENLSVTLQLKKGDVIELHFDKLTGYYGDNVWYNASITYLTDEAAAAAVLSAPLTDAQCKNIYDAKEIVDPQPFPTDGKHNLTELAALAKAGNGDYGVTYGISADGTSFTPAEGYATWDTYPFYWYNAGDGANQVNIYPTKPFGSTQNAIASASYSPAIKLTASKAGKLEIDYKLFRAEHTDDGQVGWDGVAFKIIHNGKLYLNDLLNGMFDTSTGSVVLDVQAGDEVLIIMDKRAYHWGDTQLDYDISAGYIDDSATASAEVSSTPSLAVATATQYHLYDLAIATNGNNGKYGLWFKTFDGTDYADMSYDPNNADGAWYSAIYPGNNVYPRLSAQASGKLIGFVAPTGGCNVIAYEAQRTGSMSIWYNFGNYQSASGAALTAVIKHGDTIVSTVNVPAADTAWGHAEYQTLNVTKGDMIYILLSHDTAPESSLSFMGAYVIYN